MNDFRIEKCEYIDRTYLYQEKGIARIAFGLLGYIKQYAFVYFSYKR